MAVASSQRLSFGIIRESSRSSPRLVIRRQPGRQAHEEWIGQVLLGRVAQRQNHADGAGPAEPELPCGLVDLESVFPRQRLDASPR